MRHVFLILAASTFLAVFAGCACNNCCNSCNSCASKAAVKQPPQQPPGGTVSYPYYTTRGPRDFLETHPQSIGP
jgi:hypothetical protein